MSKRGRKHAVLRKCEYGEHDGDYSEYCCLRKQWDARSQTNGWHRCELFDFKQCPFGVMRIDEYGNVVQR